MPVFQKDPDKAKAKEEARAARQKAQEEAARMRAETAAEEAFRESPQGRARAAREVNQRFFQISLDIEETERTFGSLLSGTVDTRTRQTTDQPHVLEMIEAEGWRLENVGYVFQETGSVSRDKLLSSGQVEQVTGRVVGIYLFRAVEVK